MLKRKTSIATWIMAVAAVGTLLVGILSLTVDRPTRIPSQEVKCRIDDVDIRTAKIEAKIEQMKSQGEEVADFESELNEAKLLVIEANHEWQSYNFEAADKKVEDAEQKVFNLEMRLSVAPPAAAPTAAWVWVMIGLGAIFSFAVIVLIFRTRRGY